MMKLSNKRKRSLKDMTDEIVEADESVDQAQDDFTDEDEQGYSDSMSNVDDDDNDDSNSPDEDDENEEENLDSENNSSGSDDNEEDQDDPSNILSDKKLDFLKDKICKQLYQALKEMGIKRLTKIQAETIPHLVEGRDVVASAKTGSGKTLAYLIPALEILERVVFKQWMGTGVIIVVPTRELALQIKAVLADLTKYKQNRSVAVAIGGTNLDEEVKMLSKSANILITTPGRLVWHMKNNPRFVYMLLQVLVLDETDRLLDDGFMDEIKFILSFIRKRRLNMLFSATLNEETKELAQLILKDRVDPSPFYYGLAESSTATVEGLSQGFLICPSERKLAVLVCFVKQNLSSKIMIFVATCRAAKFYTDLLNTINIDVSCLHRDHSQFQRAKAFEKFGRAKRGILMCTNIAARGLDIPDVDWIVQYDPPDDVKEYIHRVGRTARGIKGTGHSLLILRPHEKMLLWSPESKRLGTITEYELSFDTTSVKNQIQRLVMSNSYLQIAATSAFHTTVKAYAHYANKAVFNVNDLDKAQLASSLGLPQVPAEHIEKDDLRMKKKSRNY